ncbi:MAG TPA: hypothetical protein VIX12_07565 [Candidatus Binataceae bacterium]
MARTYLRVNLRQRRAEIRVCEADISYSLEPARRYVGIVWRELTMEAVENCLCILVRAVPRLERPVRRYDPSAQRRRKAAEGQALVMAKPAFEEIRDGGRGLIIRLWPYDAEGVRDAPRLGSPIA